VPSTLVWDKARSQRCAPVQSVAATLGIAWLYVPSYSPNLTWIEGLWQLVKKPCLDATYSTDLSAFTCALEDWLAHTHTTHKPVLSALFTLNLQSFKKAQSLTM